MSRPNDCIYADDLTHHDLTEKEEAILPAELFREKIIPILINIFHVREMQIRLVLLNFFPNYVGMFSKTQLEDVILPLVLLGIRDSNDNLVGETLKGTIHILRKHLRRRRGHCVLK